jgi:undecaprenyl-diphosphatase
LLVPLAAAALLLASALVAGLRQQEWEYPILRAINAHARQSAALDRAMHALTTRDLLQGVPFVALVWFCWFDVPAARARLLAGLAAAAAAGMVSRVLQLTLPTHPRPLHQAGLGFVLPFGVEPETLNHYNSFPSDHGALYFALCAVIGQARPRVAIAAAAWAVIVDLARVYEGYHFPSDISGSIGLAVLIVLLFQTRPVLLRADRVVELESSARPAFYMLAFLVSCQVATLFDDLRQLGRGLAAVLIHHDVFGGS